MAYGQTSSGKTYTINGIIPRAMQDIFTKISQSNDIYIITASFLEIYMERINDLFDPSRTNLNIQDDAQRKPHINDLTTITLSSYETFISTYKKSSKNKTISLTTMNDYSSRSHSIMIVNIINKTKALHGKLFIVDLAGSEKISKTNCQGLNIEEAKLINKSLSQLGLIIKALTTNTSHIPYRSSKLTRLLAESLGGNSRTSLILTCSPSLYNINETLSTLRFGKRAKMIRNKPLVNKEETKEDLKYKIQMLQKELQLKNEIINSIKLNDNSNNNITNGVCDMKGINSLSSCEGLVSESSNNNNWINRSGDKGGCGVKSKIFNKEVKKEIEMNRRYEE
jgi:kinesin family protein 5